MVHCITAIKGDTDYLTITQGSAGTLYFPSLASPAGSVWKVGYSKRSDMLSDSRQSK